jgi:hypothetical protein
LKIDGIKSKEIKLMKIDSNTPNCFSKSLRMNESSLFVLCYFVNSDEELCGGGVYCKGRGIEELKMSECCFMNVCSSLSGGGIFVINFSFVKIINSFVENILSGDSGGAVFL